jgi:membrane protein DedA with SNARE-associated domain
LIAASWSISFVAIGWYLGLDDRAGSQLLVVLVLVAVSLLAIALNRRVEVTSRAVRREGSPREPRAEPALSPLAGTC